MNAFRPFAYMAIAVAASCGGSSGDSVTERVWVSGLPKSPRAEFSAFATAAASSGRFVGAVFHGSAYKGAHEAFDWRADGADGAQVRFLQDGRAARLRMTSCRPNPGYDYCVILRGDSALAGRYQSRKRWVVRRRVAKHEPIWLGTQVQELLDDDPELAQLFVGAGES